MADIIGRKRELELLDRYYNSGTAEFVAIYGRRRVGKTFLIRQHYGSELVFDMTGVLEGSKSEQMTAFNMALKSSGYKGKKNNNWLDAFFALRELLSKKIVPGKRCVVFIDELPCLDTPKAGFVNALGHFWNSWANWQPEIMLVICGSATSWMVRNVIDNHGGLHDRITHEIHLHPFTLAETEQYFSSKGFLWDRLSILHTYMAIGGVPYYMSLFDATESPTMGLDRLFFSKSGELRQEYRRLFSSLFRDASPYLNIIDVLSKHPQGMTRDEIAKELNWSNNGKLGERLMNLIYCDFLCKNNSREKRIKSNSAIYQLVDFYTIFYKAFVDGGREKEHYWSLNQGRPEMNAWHGIAYERVCKSHMPQLKQALGIASVATEYYSWRSQQKNPGAQVDIIIDRADRMINLCEVKYSESVYTLDKEEYLKIMHRRDAFVQECATRSTVVPTLITTYGVSNGNYSNMIPVKLDMNALFG